MFIKQTPVRIVGQADIEVVLFEYLNYYAMFENSKNTST